MKNILFEKVYGKSIFGKLNYPKAIIDKFQGVSILTINDIPWVFKDTDIRYKIDFTVTLHNTDDILKMNKICQRVFGENVSVNGDELADWYTSNQYFCEGEELFYSIYLTTDEQYTIFLLACTDFLKK